MKIGLSSLIMIFMLGFQGLFANDIHVSRLSLLKAKGFSPKVIYDIGAWRGEWTFAMKAVFPHSAFFLFEANPNQAPFLALTRAPYFIGILGDEDKKVTFYTNDSTGDSVFLEQTQHYQKDRCREKQMDMTTLSSVIKKNKLPLPDLIKMDVQGAESLTIKGGLQAVQHAEVIILEAKILEYNKGAPLIYELMTLMDGLGYLFLDIVEAHYLPTGELNEIDILFVKKESPLIRRGILS